MNKPKHKAKSFKKMADIERVDEKTFYVKGSQEEPYMVFNSQSKGFICDCMNFVMNIQDGKEYACKHIKAIRAKYQV